MEPITVNENGWSDPVVTTEPEVWRAHGAVFITTAAVPTPGGGLFVPAGESVRIAAGKSVRVRANAATSISRDCLE